MHVKTLSAPKREAKLVLVELGIELLFLVEPVLRNPLVRVWEVVLIRGGTERWIFRLVFLVG